MAVADAIDEAIATTEESPPATGISVQLTLSSGRQAGLVLPIEMSGQDAIDIIGYLTVTLPQELAARRTAGNAILVPARRARLVTPT